MTDFDCRACGACCVGGLDDGRGYADVSVNDLMGMSTFVAAQLVKVRTFAKEPDQYRTPAIMSEEFGSLCGFLRGTPGRRCSCRIYKTRPEICQRFEPGSRRCLDAREALGMG